jgi:multidrug resistance efflux pump
MRRYLVCWGVVLLLGVAALSGCGNSDSSSGSTSVSTTAKESAAAEAKIQGIEAETRDAELEAAEAKKEAALAAAKAERVAATQARKRTVEAQKAKAEAQQVAEEEALSEEESSEPPNVVGLKLPQAKAELIGAGFTVKAVNTDTVFGIVVPSHYTVCSQTTVGSSVVQVLAQKYGC